MLLLVNLQLRRTGGALMICHCVQTLMDLTPISFESKFVWFQYWVDLYYFILFIYLRSLMVLMFLVSYHTFPRHYVCAH